jgi:anti-sigma factor RsiW
MDYLSSELPAETRQEFERHLDICENCRRYLEAYEETVTLGKHAFDDQDGPVPADVPDDLVRAILAALS